MANRENGEVSIDIGGTTYTMALTLDAMVSLEDMFSTPAKVMTFQEIAMLVERGSMKHLRGLLWAVLQLHHPDLGVKDISPIFQAGGGFVFWTNTFTELFKATNPDPKDMSALGVAQAGNPPSAQGEKRVTRGTTARSTSTRVASA